MQFFLSVHFVRDMDALQDGMPVVSVDEQAHEAARDGEEKLQEESRESVRGDNSPPKGQ